MKHLVVLYDVPDRDTSNVASEWVVQQVRNCWPESEVTSRFDYNRKTLTFETTYDHCVPLLEQTAMQVTQLMAEPEGVDTDVVQ